MLGFSRCGMFGLRDVGNVGYCTCEMFGVYMFEIWDARDVGCSGVGCSVCGMYRMWDVDS